MSKGERATPAYIRLIITLLAGLLTIVLTVVAFWLSYEHLHDVADGHGLDGERAWAWPATLDMFIVIGELLILRASLMRKIDPWSWVCASIGSVGSITLNVVGVGKGAGTLDYVIAAVPPVAALLAFGILMRQLHEAITAYVSAPPTIVPGTRTVPPVGPVTFDGDDGTDGDIRPVQWSELPEPVIPVVPDEVTTLPIVPADPLSGLTPHVDQNLFIRGSHDPIVYFIRNGHRVKIGTSTSLVRRVTDLTLEWDNVLCVIPGGHDVEGQMHSRFESLRINGTEWFSLAGDLVPYLRDKMTQDINVLEDNTSVTFLRGHVNGTRPLSLVPPSAPRTNGHRVSRPNGTGITGRVREIVRDNPGITDNEIRDKFPGDLPNTINKAISRVRKEPSP